MEEEEGTHEVYQMGTSFVAPSEARTRLPPPVELSPSIVNICKAYSGEYFFKIYFKLNC